MNLVVTLAYHLKKPSSELNEKSNDGSANGKKSCKNKRQQEKLEYQIFYVTNIHHQKCEESILQNKNLYTDSDYTDSDYQASSK